MNPTNRALPLFIAAMVLVLLVPTASAAWSTSATVPASFRPNRSVTFTYTATSSSGLDLQLHWIVALTTCKDTNQDNLCTAADAFFTDHGVRLLNVNAGASGSVSWSVSLAHPEDTYRYHFDAGCNPQFGGATCTGNQPAGASDDKTGTFQLAYTNTWALTLNAPSPVTAGSKQTVTGTVRSTSPDDRDLSGAVELFTHPPGEAETSNGTRAYSLLANQQTTLSWVDVPFPKVGQHQLRADDPNFATDALKTVTVLDVHLHVMQPRATYTEGGRFSLYLTLHGHGNPTDPEPLVDDVDVTLTNGTFVLNKTTFRTSADGTAYYSFQGAEDLPNLMWTAMTSGAWAGITYDRAANGTIQFATGGIAALAENVTAARADLDQLQFEGVHLDDLGARHVFLLAARAAGAVGLVLALVVVVFIIATRI